MTISSERRHDLDWLRVLGVLLLIPFHVALIFVLQPYTIMYIRDVVNSPALSIATGFIHMWHMPMLFMISGAGTYFALGFRSAAQYIRERFLRLFVPFLFGMLTFVPFTTYIQHSHSLSFGQAYFGFFHVDPEQLDGMSGTLTPAHLWFILYLFIFSWAGLPIFQWLRSAKGKRTIKSLEVCWQTPAGLAGLGIPLTVATATNILGAMNPLYYALIFLYGFILAGNVPFQETIDRWTGMNLVFGLIAAVLNVTMPISGYKEWSGPWLLLGLIYQMGRWSWTLAVMGLGHRYLNRTNHLLEYATEAAMPFYLLHMTFSVVTGYFVIQLDAPVAVKYPLIVVVASLLTWMAYEGVRRWQVTRWLFGMKPAIRD